MNVSLQPLSSVCTLWKGGLIPAAFDALRRGLQKERARFRGKPYVVIAIRHDYDFDGLSEDIILVDGFSDTTAAVRCAREHAEAALSRALAEPCDGNYKWRAEEFQGQGKSGTFGPRPENTVIKNIHCEQFKVANGSGYDSRYYEVYVLHVPCAEILGEELFAYINSETEWVNYLMKRGEIA